MLSVDEARARILALVAPLGLERVALLAARGRALGEDVVATRALPPWDNSAMDGFAVRAADCPEPGRVLDVVATIAAGQAPAAPIGPGQAARIMTGAPMPPGADAVVMQEHTDHGAGAAAGRVRIDEPVPPGQHVRRRGEDVAPGDVVLRAGQTVGPGEIGLLAALGRAQLGVVRAPRVAVLSTGDELCDVDEQPGPGQIVNSNAYALGAQIAEAGAVPVLLPVARDRRTEIAARLGEALTLDAVVCSGGVSVGDYDFVKDAMADVGLVLDFWKVAMKPGKPLAFGAVHGRPVFGLPGNPASSMVSFELFVRPALRRMAGHARPDDRRRELVTLAAPHAKEPGRAHFLRAVLEPPRELGERRVARLPRRQGSGMLTSMAGIDALLELPAAHGPLPAGAPVTAILLGPG